MVNGEEVASLLGSSLSSPPRRAGSPKVFLELLQIAFAGNLYIPEFLLEAAVVPAGNPIWLLVTTQNAALIVVAYGCVKSRD